jgi:putative membrane protein
MKKSEVIDFTKPTRQSHIAIITILGKTIMIVARQILPLLAVVLIGGTKNKVDLLFYIVIAVAGLTMLHSIINFFRTYFYIENDELVLESGILTKNRVSIPFNKIQSIDSEQSIIHRILNVTKFKVDTAGGAKTEFELSALDLDTAKTLRDILIQKKSTYTTHQEKTTHTDKHQHQKLVMNLEPSALLRIGITENHLRSGWIILLFGGWLINMLNDIGIDIYDKVEDVNTSIFNWTLVSTLLMFFAITSLIISLSRSFIRYYDLSFYRLESGFKVIAGLFTRKEVSAIDYKIQYITWSQNILQKFIGIHELTLHQATGKELKKREKIIIPGANNSNIDLVTQSLFRRNVVDKLPIKPIDYRYFTRFARIIYVLCFIIVGINIALDRYELASFVCFIGALLIFKRYIQWRKAGYGYDESHLWLKNGYIAGKYAILPIQKIQIITITQSPFQYRIGLCNLNFVTAAGTLKSTYILYDEGRFISDKFMHKVEQSKKLWM